MNTEFKYNDNDYFLNEDEIGDSSVSDEPTEDSGVDDMKSERDSTIKDSDDSKSETIKEATESKDSSSEMNEIVDANIDQDQVADAESDSDEGVVGASKEFDFPNLIGRKIGMTQLFSDDGTVFPATVVEAGPCTVTQIKSFDNDGYDSVQIGFMDKKESKTTKSLLGHFSKSKSSPKKFLKEFKIDSAIDNLSLGSTVHVNQFNSGDFITVVGTSKGKGFAGHMKRHGFGGGRASHGKNSVMRKAGSVGAGTSPGRIFPGMKMAGRMGNDQVSVKNLQVLTIDEKNNLIFVKGAIPGANNKIVFLTKS